MSSGKQLSFQYGEVAPSQHYKSDAVSYAQGLRKLRNMFVRRDGGVSNRPGLEFVKVSPYQQKIPAPGDARGIAGFTFWSNEFQAWKTAVYTQRVDGKYAFYIDGKELSLVSLETIVGPTPDKIKFTVIKDKVFITPALELTDYSNNRFLNVAIKYAKNPLTLVEGFNIYTDAGRDFYPGTLSAVTAGFSGTAPYLPASYLVTATMVDGQELYVTDYKTVGYTNYNTPPTNSVVFPHEQMTVQATITLSAARSDVKAFNLYRAAGDGGIGNSFYKLAATVPYVKPNTVITFRDFGADDPSRTPPLDFSMLGGDPGTGDRFKYLLGANAAAYYQQRLVLAMQPDCAPAIKAGDMIASKLGSPLQFKAPIIYSDTGAFQFSIPVTDGTPVHAVLGMERLIAFTQRGVYVVRGGQQGVFTPSQVNPLCVSEEGCSIVVEPKMSGRRGYFVNNNHTKLMAIEFNLDGNLNVYEASSFSDHFLYEQDVVALEVLGGGEDTVYLLRRDGSLVRVTSVDDGAQGFALMETSGYIESIFRGKAKRKYTPVTTNMASEVYHDVLMAHVIRSGVRTLERLNFRYDRKKEGEFFADCFTSFGWRLADAGNLGYSKTGFLQGPRLLTDVPTVDTTAINIGPVSDYTLGHAVTITSTSPITPYIVAPDGAIHFYYTDSTGVKRAIRFMLDSAYGVVSTGSSPFAYKYSGTFSDDVPLELQNVQGKTTLNAVEKLKQQTLWLPAINRLTGNTANEADDLQGPWFAAAGRDLFTDVVDVPVTVMAEGEVLSSPLNPSKPTLNVHMAFGALSLDLGDYFTYGYVGVPYTSEIETLDIEAGDNRTLTDTQKIINKVGLGILETRGGYFGIPDKTFDQMEEIMLRIDGDISQATQNKTGHIEVSIPTEWTEGGRVSIKNVDPVPMTILSVYPKGIAGD